MEQTVGFSSSGLKLVGVLHVPERTGKRPGLVLCHGFGGNCRGAGHPELARALERAGYAVLRFDFRGCGESEGKRGNIICAEEVEDARSAVGFLAAHEAVDGERIGVVGASLGGSIAIELAAGDPRVKLCVANGAIGKGERRFRYQYPDETRWRAFLRQLEDAKRARDGGRPTLINRFDIVEIPPASRAGLPPGATMEFTVETALSMLAHEPERVVAKIAPRPLLLLHPRGDKVVPVTESENLAKAAGANCELRIIESHDHFGVGAPPQTTILLDWLGRNLSAA